MRERSDVAHGNPADEDSTKSDADPWVPCAACASPLAPERARIDVDGAHEHAFLNPGGMRFVVMCFAAAPGCRPEGERSDVWTWFPGRAWQAVVCAACGAHAGWSFHAPEGRAFWALIRVMSC